MVDVLKLNDIISTLIGAGRRAWMNFFVGITDRNWYEQLKDSQVDWCIREAIKTATDNDAENN